MTEKRDILSLAELAQLIDALSSLEDRALFCFLFLSGARINEVLELKRSNFVFTRDDLSLVVEIVTSKSFKDEKTKIRRTLWFPLVFEGDSEESRLKNRFMGFLVKRLEELQEPEKRVFPISYRTALRRLKAVLPSAWLHLFRKTRASIFARKGGTDSQLMAWFGWQDKRTSQHYVVLDENTAKPLSRLL